MHFLFYFFNNYLRGQFVQKLTETVNFEGLYFLNNFEIRKVMI